jgi:glutamate synthase (NADPH/NADH)
MAPTLNATPTNSKKTVSFASTNHVDPVIDSSVDDGPVGDHAPDVLRDPAYLGLPAKQGLYNPENESDNCGVGFICHISQSERAGYPIRRRALTFLRHPEGQPSHKIVSDAKALLCESLAG